MGNLTCELNGIKYLLVEILVDGDDGPKTRRNIKKHECILHGVKELRRSWFIFRGYAILTILVPEKNVIAWNKENL